MKKPHKPVEPKKPERVVTVRREISFDIEEKTNFQELIDRIQKNCTLAIGNTVPLDKIYFEPYGYDSYGGHSVSVYYEYCENITVDETQYYKQVEKYNRALFAYEAKLFVYEESMKLYNVFLAEKELKGKEKAKQLELKLLDQLKRKYEK